MGDGALDAIVVGAGPNGLAAAVTLAEAGLSVEVLEAADRAGGGTRSEELTLPGFVHDTCAAVHPLAAQSPFFRGLPLHEYGLRWIQADVPLAHPLDDGTAAVLHRSVDATAAGLGGDGAAYRRLLAPLTDAADRIVPHLLGPLLRPPRNPLALAGFGWRGIRSARALAGRFEGTPARALTAGLAAHSVQPLDRAGTAAFALLFAMLGHTTGWPVAAGGSQALADALVAYLEVLGGRVRTGRTVATVDDLPAAAVLLDVTPVQVLDLAGHRLPAGYRRRLQRFPYGPGVFKVDYALDGPIPWTADGVAGAGTVHVGGTFEEIAVAEAAVAAGRHPQRPFVLVAQQSVCDDTRAPRGQHTAWAYCHVPNGSRQDMSARIDAQIERFAPGFGARVLARCDRGPRDLQRHNANLVGGDINGGSATLRHLLARPVLSPDPYATPADGIFLCSASTPPGGGVHGMCGHHAARSVLRRTAR